MTSKNISIQKNVYDRLKSERQPGESFTDVINRLLRKKAPPLIQFAGAISDESAGKIEKAIEELSKLDDNRVKRMLEDRR